MRPELVLSLQALAEALPAGAAVPVPREWLLELLEASTRPVQTTPADLTVADLCARYGRKPSAVRAWLEGGKDFPGAYKLKGRDWRVPAAAVAAFDAKQQAGGGAADGAPAASGELGAWRTLRRPRAG